MIGRYLNIPDSGDCFWTLPNAENGVSGNLFIGEKRMLMDSITENSHPGRASDPEWRWIWKGNDKFDCGFRLKKTIQADSGSWKYFIGKDGLINGSVTVTIEGI
jgi:hypothetical protein